MNTSKLIAAIFSQSTAPFREGYVLCKISEILTANQIPYFKDSVGNIIAGVKTPKELKHKKIGFLAHTDHPGFHITRRLSQRDYEAVWYGGAPFDKMKGAKLRIYDPVNPQLSYQAKVLSFPKVDYTRAGMEFTLRLNLIPAKGQRLDSNYFGAFDFLGYKMKKTLIETRVADDLAGVVIILGMLIDIKKKSGELPIGIFTRAEEVGYIGCWALLSSGILPKSLQVVSLEASRTLPGAEIGKGPVLRLGDASTLFDSELSIELWNVAKDLAKIKKSFSFQRRIMDGGSCEATALDLFNYKATGIAVPLGNYHNQGPSGPAPEIVDIHDVEKARTVCTHFAIHMISGKKLKKAERKSRLHKNYVTLKKLLMTGKKS
ncbi:MAG: hypothetical protein SGJ18_09810 [Pseudomonadota bacterium]|nr:hypothetical protein [Pseudomonadota bacterium]